MCVCVCVCVWTQLNLHLTVQKQFSRYFICVIYLCESRFLIIIYHLIHGVILMWHMLHDLYNYRFLTNEWAIVHSNAVRVRICLSRDFFEYSYISRLYM